MSSGHQVLEIRPRVSWNKGTAVQWVIERLDESSHRLVFYFGDDRTDEDAFASLPDGVTVKVASEATRTLARYQLTDPDAVEHFLSWLAEKLGALLIH